MRKKPISARFIHSSDTETEEVATTKKKITCDRCNFTASTNWHMKRHSRTHKHDLVQQAGYKCPEHGCEWFCTRLDELDRHLHDIHKRTITAETLHFKDEEEVKRWMQRIQEEEFSKYVKVRQSGKSQAYSCNRSSHVSKKSKSTGKRSLKKKGSIKSDHVCTSWIKILKLETGLQVMYFKTHSGHSIEPGRTGLSSPQKRNVAQLLNDGVPKRTALQKLRTQHEVEVNRAGISNLQDIHNIARKYNIDSGTRLDESDAKSLDLTIKKLQNDGDNGVFLYKPVGVTSQKFPGISESDFLMAYMNEAQQLMLEKHGKNIICIDGTHSTNAYGFELSSIIVLDDQHQGFPVVFFYHSNKSEETYRVLFQCLRDRVGEIRCNVFMSDDEPALYNSWLIMGPVKTKLLCTWHVMRNWKKHLAGLESSLRMDIFSKQRAIMTTLDRITFEEGLLAFVRFLSVSPKLKTFYEYFVNYYVNRTSEWAYCHRVGTGINTNMHIENMHRNIKYNYFHGKKVSRMDTSFSAIREFLNNKQRDRLISITRGKITTKDRDLRTAHTTSLKLKTSSVFGMGDHWIIQSSTIDAEYYTIYIADLKCMCSIICPQCVVCLHAYRCSCIENSIRNNMCKHIHLLCRFLKEHPSANKSEIEPVDEDDSEDLIIDTNTQMELLETEARAHLLDLSRQNRVKDTDVERKLATDYFIKSLELATEPKSANALAEGMKTVFASMELFKANETGPIMLKAACKDAPNKNAERQPRFVCKKKKKIAHESHLPGSVVLAQLIMPGKILPYNSTSEIDRGREQPVDVQMGEV